MTTTPRVPELRAGDRLTRDEFERRYAAMPDLKKAELIEGMVYMGSPVRYTHHGRPEYVLGFWAGCYDALTPGLSGAHNSTLRLDQDNVPQPDLLLRLPESAGGGSRVTDDGDLEGRPNWPSRSRPARSATICTRRRTPIAAAACASISCTGSTTARSTDSCSSAASTCARIPIPKGF